ncbi:MAG TPA: alpha/beta hydrolase [Pseudonocardiaceae bacterium]|jgi:acetyl esterase/lipase|nr:alpha/beta hydrolase [Pseudonocardiaceae bacterium]
MSELPVVDHRVGVSVRARLVYAAARLMLRPLMTYWPLNPIGLCPLPLVDVAAQLLPTPRDTEFERADFDGFRGEWARAEGVALDGAVLYFHGGAFIACGLATHRHAVAKISAACGLPVLSVAYRQLPAVSVAGSLADCLTAYRSLLDSGLDPSRIVFAGDSAGGHLAFATALAAGVAGLPRPAGIVALSPWLDFDPATKLAHPNAARDAYAPASRLPRLSMLCTGGVAGSVLDPLSSPINHQLADLPPVLMMAAEDEMLRCDAELMAQRLALAGVPCTLQIWAGQVHAFPVLGDLLPESRAAIHEIGVFIRAVTATAEAVDEPAPELRALAG